MKYFIGGRTVHAATRTHSGPPRICKADDDGDVYCFANVNGRRILPRFSWFRLSTNMDAEDVMIDNMLSMLEWVARYSDALEDFCKEL